MDYISTRDSSLRLSAAEAIARGLSREGGLFVPDSLPEVTEEELHKLCKMSYQERAVRIMSPFLDGFTVEELQGYAKAAYGSFDCPEAAPVRTLDGSTHFLELWHGPTCAFKDIALQMLPHLLTASMKKSGASEKVCILVATSGDTGKAALEGFRDVEGTGIVVFYPENGVSDVQKLQMTSQEGANVKVVGVRGNFDDAQTGVKRIFSDAALREELLSRGWVLSSANSINWGRLLPQIVYYFSAWCDLVNAGHLAFGEKLDFCVPTGNFGDILAGYYAKKMGLPVGRLICASNENNVLTDFISTGVYDKNRPFHMTSSPSMDILVSSNLERLIYDLAGRDDKLTAGYMAELSSSGRYKVTDAMLKSLQEEFSAGFCDGAETETVIRETFGKDGYLIDTHTAVAYGALKKYRREMGRDNKCVVVSTASPYKFCGDVLKAIGKPSDRPGPELIAVLEEASGVRAPEPLRTLVGKQRRFTLSVDKDAMAGEVMSFLE